MPQMAPLNWMILYPYFILLLYLFLIHIYFVKESKNIISDSNTKINPTSTWKW